MLDYTINQDLINLIDQHSVLARGPPGPGEYNLRADLGSGVPKYSMPGRGADLRPKVGVDAPSPS